jgi:hypothetical protein
VGIRDQTVDIDRIVGNAKKWYRNAE